MTPKHPMMKHTIEIIDDDQVDSLLDKLTQLSVSQQQQQQQTPKSDMDQCVADILELKKNTLDVNDPPPLFHRKPIKVGPSNCRLLDTC